MRSFLALSFIFAACGDNLAYDPYEHESDETRTVKLWVDAHPDVPPSTATAACEAWWPEGIRCEIASAAEALIRIHHEEGSCEPRENGDYPLGTATVGGDITLHIECLRLFGGMPVAESFLWPVIGHEVGHQLGIWTHVPREDGIALMNPTVNDGLDNMTLLDHVAYEMRDLDISVLDVEGHGCTLVTFD